MSETSRHDAWQAGEAYDGYMGRWSRRIAPRFLDWLDPADGLDWLDVGCGTGALTEAILARAAPRAVVGIDPSDGFVTRARAVCGDGRARFAAGDAQALPVADGAADMVVSGLVLNFVAERETALAEMRRAARPGGRVAFYVWDYPGGGLAFVRAFWAEAVALDPAAADLREGARFGFCEPTALTRLAADSGLAAVTRAPLEARSVFRDFDEFWLPFTLGAGPAPGYCAKLPEEARERLRERLRSRLPAADDGTISLGLRAWAVAGHVP